MASGDLYDSPTPRHWACVVCGKFVDSERHVAVVDGHLQANPKRRRLYDPSINQTVEVWHTPASRYWHAKGVLCGPECAMAAHNADVRGEVVTLRECKEVSE